MQADIRPMQSHVDMGDNEPVHTISSMDLSREEKDDILGGNVIKALSGKGILE